MEGWMIEIWMDFSKFERILFIVIISFLIIYNINYYLSDIIDFIKSMFKTMSIFLKKIFKGKTKKIEEGKMTKDEILEMILNHDLMLLIKKLEFENEYKNYGDPIKTKIFKLVFNIYLDTIKENFILIPKNFDIDQLKLSELKKIIYDTFLNIMTDCNKKLKFELGPEIYNLIMLDPIKGYRSLEELNYSMEWKFIDAIDNGGCFSNLDYNHKILSFLMDTKNITLQILSNNLEKRFIGFNGELDYLIKKYDWK